MQRANEITKRKLDIASICEIILLPTFQWVHVVGVFFVLWCIFIIIISVKCIYVPLDIQRTWRLVRFNLICSEVPKWTSMCALCTIIIIKCRLLVHLFQTILHIIAEKKTTSYEPSRMKVESRFVHDNTRTLWNVKRAFKVVNKRNP